MKKALYILLLLGMCGVSFAQDIKGSLTAKSREDMLKKLPLDVAYWYPEFAEATVFYNDGTKTTSTLNICVVDNTLRFINKTGDTLVAGNINKVQRVLIDDALMMRNEDYFVKEIARFGSICLAERKIFTYNEPESKDVGYSMAPATSTAKKVNIRDYDYTRSYGFEALIDWRLETKFVMTDGKKYYFVKKSTFEKIFPDKKDFIRTFVKMNDTDFTDKQDIVSLFWYCIENN